MDPGVEGRDRSAPPTEPGTLYTGPAHTQNIGNMDTETARDRDNERKRDGEPGTLYTGPAHTQNIGNMTQRH